MRARVERLPVRRLERFVTSYTPDAIVCTSAAVRAAAEEAGPPIFRSVFFSCPTPFRDEADVSAAQIQAIFTGNNTVPTGTSTLQNLFVNGPNESQVTATDPRPISNFFQNVGYIGAVRDNNDLWFVGWTCGLGFTTPACTANPAA